MTVFYHHLRGSTIEKAHVDEAAEHKGKKLPKERKTYTIQVQDSSGMDIKIFVSQEQLLELMAKWKNDVREILQHED